jgi:hypothetical protein
MALFRLKDNQALPNLPTLKITRTHPVAGDRVVMLGVGGMNDGSGIHYYKFVPPDGSSWTEVSDPQQANYAGIRYTLSDRVRWGENIVEGGGDISPFGTIFDNLQWTGQTTPTE